MPDQILKLFVIPGIGINYGLRGFFPTSDLLECPAAIVSDAAVVDEELAGDRFSFVGK